MIVVKEEFLVSKKLRRAIEIGGHEALTLWLFLKGYAAQHPSDGFVPDEEIDDVTHGLVRRARYKLSALTECGHLQRDGTRGPGLVDKVEHGWQLHDYEDHANSQTDEELRREKARLKKRAQREQKERELAELRKRGQKGTPSPGQDVTDGGDNEGQNGDENETRPGDASAAGGGAHAHVHASARPDVGSARSQPNPTQPSGKEEDPPSPRPKPADRMRASFASFRPDVRELHESYKQTFGLSSHKISGVSDLNYQTLAEAIDAHGLDACRAALRVAKLDDWVNGAADNGQRHEKISYVFGNPDTLARLLRAAESEAKKRRSTGGLEASMTAEPDLSDYTEPEVPCPQQ